MLSIHPIIQLMAAALSWYVLYLGLQRFRVLHLKQKAAFNWKRHVRLGEAVAVIWLAGMVGGKIVAQATWPGVPLPGAHSEIARIMLVLIVIALATGEYMHRAKKRRTFLPLVHAVNNMILVGLGVVQIWTGWRVYSQFVLGQ